MSRPTKSVSRPDALARAAEVFVRGFTFTRSFTHPYLGERVGALWAMRDAPRKNPADYRREEWVALGTSAADVDRLVRRETRGRFAVCALLPAGEPDTGLRAEYKTAGYMLKATEPMMVNPLRRIPRATSPATISQVTTAEAAEALAKAARTRQILSAHLAPGAPLRAYVATVDGAIVGWVRSIECEAGTWCSNMYVQPAHRRRGIASALLAQLLRDDRARGAECAGLTASHTGAKLYVNVGYGQIGTLYLFMPRK